MTLVIVTIILLSYILIATEKFTNISKAAVAIFVGTLVWILYVGYGMDFVTTHHSSEYANFLALRPSSSVEVKNFIAQIRRQSLRGGVVPALHYGNNGDIGEQRLLRLSYATDTDAP